MWLAIGVLAPQIRSGEIDNLVAATAQPLMIALTMQSVKPFAVSSVMELRGDFLSSTARRIEP